MDDGLNKYQRYYRRNKAKKHRQVAAWKASNPERARELDRASYARHAAQRRADAQARNPRRAELRATDEGRLAERLRKQRRRATIQLGEFRVADWEAILAFHGYRCAWCYCDGPMEIDHVEPLALGGRHEPGNIVPACKPCNSSRGGKVPRRR